MKLPAAVEPSTFSETLRATAALSSGSADLDAIFEAASQKYSISPNLLKAVAKVESNFRPLVTSSAGAMGIMQLMPATAASLGVAEVFDPEQNIMGGAKYLRQMLDRFGGDIGLALGAYNAGPGAVARYNGVPPYSQNYVSKVLRLFNGSDITAGISGITEYGGSGGRGQEGTASGTSFGSYALREALSQMVFIKVIEMQMDSSSDEKSKII
jgi:hypothetical protein